MVKFTNQRLCGQKGKLMIFLVMSRSEPDPKKYPIYWIVDFPFYGKFVFYGTESQATEFFEKTSKREGRGNIRKANPKSREDQEMVQTEIQAVFEDIQAGIELPYYPHEGGF